MFHSATQQLLQQRQQLLQQRGCLC
jgi:hypothetical protein